MRSGMRNLIIFWNIETQHNLKFFYQKNNRPENKTR